MGTIVPLAIAIAPELGKWMFGDTAEAATAAVLQAVETVTGTADPDASAAVLQKDPATASRLRLQLAQIAAEQEKASHAADLDQITASLRSAALPANDLPPPPAERSALSWSAPVISTVVLLTFGAVMAIVLLYGMPTGSETAANMLLGTLAAMATSVVSYWVGSSAGSARKDDRLAQAGK